MSEQSEHDEQETDAVSTTLEWKPYPMESDGFIASAEFSHGRAYLHKSGEVAVAVDVSEGD